MEFEFIFYVLVKTEIAIQIYLNDTPKQANPNQQMLNEFYYHRPIVLVEYRRSTRDHGHAKKFPVLRTSWSQLNVK